MEKVQRKLRRCLVHSSTVLVQIQRRRERASERASERNRWREGGDMQGGAIGAVFSAQSVDAGMVAWVGGVESVS